MSMVNPRFKILPEEQRLQWLTNPPDHCPFNKFASLVGDDRWISKDGILQRRSPFEGSILLAKSSKRSKGVSKKKDSRKQKMGQIAEEAVRKYLSERYQEEFEKTVVKEGNITGSIDGLSSIMALEVKTSSIYMNLSMEQLQAMNIQHTGKAWWQAIMGAYCTSRSSACIALIYPTADDYDSMSIAKISNRAIFFHYPLEEYRSLIESRLTTFDKNIEDIKCGFTPRYDLSNPRDLYYLSIIDPGKCWQS